MRPRLDPRRSRARRASTCLARATRALALGACAAALTVAACSPRGEPPALVAGDAGSLGGGPPGPTEWPNPTRMFPPVGASTLITLHEVGSDGTSHEGLVAATDADRDQVVVVEPERQVLVRLPLEEGAQPGRLVEGAGGVLHVVLRGTGELLSFDPWAFDPATHEGVSRVFVCTSPRGVEVERAASGDPARGRVVVVCQRGELVVVEDGLVVEEHLALDAYPSGAPRVLDDLRDVVHVNGRWVVSRMRSAELAVLDESFRARLRSALPVPPFRVASSALRLGWLDGKGEPPVVRHQLSVQPHGATGHGSHLYDYPRTAEISFSLDEAGAFVFGPLFDDDHDVPSSLPTLPFVAYTTSDCQVTITTVPPAGQAPSEHRCDDDRRAIDLVRTDRVELVQTRMRVAGVLVGPDVDVLEEGHRVFHAAPDNVSCATCHLEGLDDGLSWQMDPTLTVPWGEEVQRTQAVAGGVLDTAPFHWAGSLPTLSHLFAKKIHHMGGYPVSGRELLHLATWLDALPRVPASAGLDPDEVASGAVVFAERGCATCHAGEQLTSVELFDLGTGTLLQAPRLVGVELRAPYFSNGCAPTLDALLDDLACGGQAHALGASKSAPLEARDRLALLTFLRSL